MNERELARKARVAQLLLDAARTFGETVDPERVYDRFHALLSDFVLHDGVLVSSYDEGDGLIRCEYAWSDGNRLDTSVFPPVALNRSGGGMQSKVIITGESSLFNDVAEKVQQPGGTYYDEERGVFQGLFCAQEQTKEELFETYREMVRDFPFVIIEDPLGEDDYEGHAELTRELFQLVADQAAIRATCR